MWLVVSSLQPVAERTGAKVSVTCTDQEVEMLSTSYHHRVTFFLDYLSIDSVGLLPSTVEQRPSFVLHITHVYVVAIIFTKGDPGSAKHEEVVAMQNS